MVSESALIIKSTREVIMGCGNVKQEGDKGVSLPTKEGVGGRLTGRKMQPDPRNKLSPEVLQGFTKLVKSFYVTPQPHIRKAALSNQTSGTEKQARDVLDDNLRSDPTQNLDSKPTEFPSGHAYQELLRGEQSRTLLVPRVDDRRGNGHGTTLSQIEEAYSPEAGRPESLDDPSPWRDTLQADRLEKERKAKEEAESKAARLREEEERQAGERNGVIRGMTTEAASIMSKYQ